MLAASCSFKTLERAAYEEIRRASLPFLPHQRSIQHMCQIVREAFEPSGMVKANRMRFGSLVQRDGQSAQAFCNVLQVAAEHCNFGVAYSMTLKKPTYSWNQG